MRVNIPDQLPFSIKVVNLSDFENKISVALLDHVTLRAYKNGVKRKNYYLIKTGCMYRFEKLTNEVRTFISIMDRVVGTGHQSLMIKF